MKVRLALSRRRSKIIAAGVILYERGLRMWMLLVYSVTDGAACPFSGAFAESLEEIMAKGAEILKVNEDDWFKIEDSEAEGYIVRHARNRWYPSKYKRVVEAEGRSGRSRRK